LAIRENKWSSTVIKVTTEKLQVIVSTGRGMK